MSVIDTTHDGLVHSPPPYLSAMPLHAIAEAYGEAGLRGRWSWNCAANG